MAGSDFSDWYKAIPQISRYWFTGSVVLPLLSRFGILGAYSLVLLFEPFIYKFQVSRLDSYPHHAFHISAEKQFIRVSSRYGVQWPRSSSIRLHHRPASRISSISISSTPTRLDWKQVSLLNIPSFRNMKVELLKPTYLSSRHFWWTSSRFLVHAHLQLAMLGHHRPSRQYHGKPTDRQ